MHDHTYRNSRALCETPLLLLAFALCVAGCNAVTSSSTPPPITPPAVSVSVSPTAASIPAGGTQPFTATVSNTTNTAVTWSVNGISGGNTTVGTISSSGSYVAPQNVPQPATVTVQATSQADATASGSATVTITSGLSVSVTPTSASVELGAAQSFIAQVSGAGGASSAVSWSLAGQGCAGAACGTIDTNGNYVAPQVMPASPTITVTATSAANPSKAASAALTITSHFTLNISGPNSVNAGATANYVATLTPVGNSNPSMIITWNLSGAGCAGAACGTVSSSGANAVFQAPTNAPAPNVVTLTATPAADPTKAVSMSVTIDGQISVVVSPANASVALGTTQIFTAQVTGIANTNVTWDVNGIASGNATLGTVSNNSGSDITTYTAPSVLPSPFTVTIHATSAANANISGQAVVTLTSSESVMLAPATATLAISHRQTFSAVVSGGAITNVTWQVNGIPGGNSTVGQICVVASNPCQAVTTAPAGSVDYLSPVAVPSPNPVTLSAIGQANPGQSASAQITVLAHIVVSVSPPGATLSPGATQTFTAAVLGTSNQSVTWNVTGTACANASSPCGTITQNGVYTAPLSAPSPDAFNIVATSSEDTSRTGSAAATITTSATITSLLPASGFAGSVGGFTLRVQGGNLALTNPGPGSVILVGGTAHTTSCTTNGVCTTSLSAADVAAVGSLTIQIENPDSTFSNIVNYVVALESAANDVIALTPANPTVTGKDISVVEPSTAGSAAPQANVTLAVAAMGIFSTVSNSCTLGAGSLTLTRPASGTAIIDICVFSVSGLDSSFAFTLTGPAIPDITIIGEQPLGLGIVDLTLSIPSSALPGLRSLFVENPNKDKAAASGVLEVK
jgi:hypothetical protein